MCVIMSKPVGVAFPEESILKNCWDNNPDMGGFMYALNGHVYIQKGFDTWEKFITALNKTRAKTGDNIPYVCHFRISTQGYDTSCCQPFPLSGKMKNLKKERVETNIGVAHNGILSITSDGSKFYSDTMKFITDYLVNIIRSFDWYKDNRTVKLIENLISGSRFAILDKNGVINALGSGWIEDKGCYFSNSTYSYKKHTYVGGYVRGVRSYYQKSIFDDETDDYYYKKYWENHTKEVANKLEKLSTASQSNTEDDYIDEWDTYYNEKTGMYDFSDLYCPYTAEDDDCYCSCCSRMKSCPYVQACLKASGE